MHTDIQLRPIDLAFQAAKKRQSPRTGFVHFFYGNDLASDTIPFYENICYALALLHQRKAETVLEAKDLILRLLSFQTAEGNFPVYLHDYPRCFSVLSGLKAIPLLLRASGLSSIGMECKEKIDTSIARIFSFYETLRVHRPLTALWEYRYQMCRAVWRGEELPEDTIDSSQFSASDWWEYWVSKQFQETPKCDFYHPGLKLCLGPFLFDRAQNGFEPSLSLIDWACKDGCSVIHDHPLQIGLAALESIEIDPKPKSCRIGASFALLTRPETGNWNIFWKEDLVHSFSLEVLDAKVSLISEENQLLKIDLPAVFELNRDDLFELSFFVDASPDMTLWINELKGTSFYLGDWIQVRSSQGRCISLRFDLAQGEGDFCGHIYRSNRSNQQLTTRGESFDWKVGLRTLRRSEKCVVSVEIRLQNFQEN